MFARTYTLTLVESQLMDSYKLTNIIKGQQLQLQQQQLCSNDYLSGTINVTFDVVTITTMASGRGLVP